VTIIIQKQYEYVLIWFFFYDSKAEFPAAITAGFIVTEINLIG